MTYSQFREQQETFLSIHGNIRYIDKGVGDVIVLLHGIPTSGWLYRKMIAELSQTNRVIIPDMLGFGSSDSPKGYDIYEPSEHANRLLALMDYLKIQSWHHVFHDAGGLWTWEILKRKPEKIKQLIILNTIIYEEGFRPPIRFRKGIIAKCIMALYSNGVTTNSMLKGLFKTGLVDSKIINSSDIEGYKKPLLEGKTKAMYQFFTNTCNDLPDYSAVFEALNLPKCLIWGNHDEFLVLNRMKEKVITNLKIADKHCHILDAKHFIQEEKPAQISAIIKNFLS